MTELDNRINALFREQDAMKARGEDGFLVPGKGWQNVSPRYDTVLKELRELTRARLSLFAQNSLEPDLTSQTGMLVEHPQGY